MSSKEEKRPFLVSARKYRPTNFKSIIGQPHITSTLKNAIQQNKIAQAFLFCGSRGVGKTTCARVMAKTINCTQPTAEWEACNECRVCKSINQQTALQIHELDAASNNSVEDIRQLIKQVQYNPQIAKYTIFIIDEVHMLSDSAFNAFLKTLEEPPSYAIFILATTEKQKILPTILSRCQIFEFKKIQNKDIVQYLKQIAIEEEREIEEDALYLIAQKSEGALRDALSMFDLVATATNTRNITYQDAIQNLHLIDYTFFFEITKAIMERDISEAFLLYDQIYKLGYSGHFFMISFGEHLRNLMLYNTTHTQNLLQISTKMHEKYQKQSKQLSFGRIIQYLNIINDFSLQYKQSKNQRLHVELMLVKLASLERNLELVSEEKTNITEKLAEVNQQIIENKTNPESRQKRPEEEITLQYNVKKEKTSNKESLVKEISNKFEEEKDDNQRKVAEKINKTNPTNLRKYKTVEIPSLEDLMSNSLKDEFNASQQENNKRTEQNMKQLKTKQVDGRDTNKTSESKLDGKLKKNYEKYPIIQEIKTRWECTSLETQKN